MDRYLSDYEKLLHEYERIESKLNSLFIQTDLSESARKRLEISLKRRLKTLRPELRKKELEV